VAVLHDYSLLGLHRLVGQQYGERRTQQMRFAEEYPDQAPEVWEDDLRLDALAYEDFPMTGPILQGNRAVVVHSAWLRARVRSHAPSELRVEHIPMGVDFAAADAPRPSREELRRRYLLPPDAFVVASVGVINRLKRLDIALEAFEEFHRTCPESRFVLVGPADRAVLRRMVGLCRSRRILHAVRFLGHRDIADLNDVIAMADVCVNLRYPTMGESSATLAAILAMGRPALVTPIGQFQEFPDDVCWKVRLGAGEKLEMVEYFRCLRAQPEVARELGSNARKFVEGWGWPLVARRYEELLGEVARDSRTLPAI
jgi:glycosyltransferase involved in cell wall biosynthesis